jgi:hypothetical protein
VDDQAEYSRTAPQAIRNASTMVPTQTALTVAFCSLRPKKNMIAAPKAGSSGISQMWVRNIIVLVLLAFGFTLKLIWPGQRLRANELRAVPLPLQQMHFVYVHRLLVAEEGDQDSQADRSFGGGVGDDKDGEDLAVQSSPHAREGDQDSGSRRSESARLTSGR